jgi:hypothetical protein
MSEHKLMISQANQNSFEISYSTWAHTILLTEWA